MVRIATDKRGIVHLKLRLCWAGIVSAMPHLHKNIPNYSFIMAIQLPDHLREGIYLKLKASYDDFDLFEPVVADKLKAFIADSQSYEINYESAKKKVKKAYPTVKDEDLKLVLKQAQLIHYGALVEIMATSAAGKEKLASDIHQLTEAYPSFVGLPVERLEFLFEFWNFMKVALMVMPAKHNKLDLLHIVGRLAGSKERLVTGKGQKSIVRQCVLIYETEGKIAAEKRPDRTRPPKKSGPRNRDRSKPKGAPRANKLRLANDVKLTAEEIAAVRGEGDLPVTKKRRTSVSSRSSGRASPSDSSSSSSSCSDSSDSDNSVSDDGQSGSASTDMMCTDIDWRGHFPVSHSSDTDTTYSTDPHHFVHSHPSFYYPPTTTSTSTSSSAVMQSFHHLQVSTSIPSNLDGHVFAQKIGAGGAACTAPEYAPNPDVIASAVGEAALDGIVLPDPNAWVFLQDSNYF